MPNNNIIDERNSNIQIYINGSFYFRDDAKISVFDSGFYSVMEFGRESDL